MQAASIDVLRVCTFTANGSQSPVSPAQVFPRETGAQDHLPRQAQKLTHLSHVGKLAGRTVDTPAAVLQSRVLGSQESHGTHNLGAAVLRECAWNHLTRGRAA